MTKFCGTTVDLGHGLSLFIDGNSKVTRSNGTFAAPAPNCLSLPHISTCPGATQTCMAACYVHGLKANQPELYARYAENERTIHALMIFTQTPYDEVTSALAAWITEHCPGGFRWHVSGDVFSPDHACWIADVSLLAPDVPFWIYTRSLWAVSYLRKARNLTVNISADADNYLDALVFHRLTGARLCYLTHDGTLPDLPPGSVIFPDYALRGRDLADPASAPWWQSLTPEQRKMVCPADFFGQSEQHRCGPCTKCLVAP